MLNHIIFLCALTTSSTFVGNFPRLMDGHLVALRHVGQEERSPRQQDLESDIGRVHRWRVHGEDTTVKFHWIFECLVNFDEIH